MSARQALREHWPEYLIEAGALGTFMVSACLFVSLLEYPGSAVRGALGDPFVRRALVGLAMGLTAVTIIYSPWGKRSGAHVNPAVTLTFYLLGKIARWDAIFYVLAQFAGGMSGVLLARLILGDGIVGAPQVRYVITQPGSYGTAAAFVAEATIAFVLMTVVLNISNNRRLNRYTGLCAGLLVATYITLEAPISGMSMNPARSFGSAVSAQIWNALWIYFTAPLLGMLVAAEIYQRVRGAEAVLCCKLHHDNDQRCIFHCRYGSRAEPFTGSAASNLADRLTASALHRWVAAALGLTIRGFRIAERSIGPLFDLLLRLRLAQLYFVSGVLKVAHWDTALYLAAEEYPVSWMDPVAAAYVGASIELGGSVLLALGLATRPAALAMGALAVVTQFSYVALDANLFWVVLFAWYAVRGAGAFSLDHAVSRGLADSALPLASLAVRAAEWLSHYLGPVYALMLRAWSAAALLLAGHSTGWSSYLPAQSATVFPNSLAIGCALLLLAGLATRFAALALILTVLFGQMVDPRMTEDWYWLVVFGLIALYGPGALSADALIARQLGRVFPQIEGKPAFSLEDLPRVVIVGGGFGGLACAAALRHARVAVTLIDRHNFHLFQPLLYQVATAGLAPGDIATPIRGLFRDDFSIRVLLGEVTGVDTGNREVLLGKDRVPYDFLVLATGAGHGYFGRDDWEPYAPGLKSVEDATEVRRRLLLAFERAEAEDDVAEHQALLTFLIVGGGPTGVELAGAIAELARYGMEKEFRRFDPATARVILVQSAPRILPTFPERLSQRARRSLERLGVEVLTNHRVEQIDAEGVQVSGRRIPARTVFWAAGVVASPAAKWLQAEADNAGRLKVNPDLSVPGLSEVFALGDTALVYAWQGRPVPGLAPAAKQGGAYVARVIRAKLAGREVPGPFIYRHLGSLATIGRKAAVADFGGLRISGAPAWWLWGAVHLAFLVGLRNRFSVLFDWFWAYLTFRSGTRLITGSVERPQPAAKGREMPDDTRRPLIVPGERPAA